MSKDQKLSQLDLQMLGDRGFMSRIKALEQGVRSASGITGGTSAEATDTVRPNLAVNSSFEYYDKNATVPQNWALSYGTVALQTTSPQDGTTYLSTTNGATLTQQPFGGGTNTPAGSYVLSVYAKSVATPMRVVLGMNLPGQSVASDQYVFTNINEDSSAASDTLNPSGTWFRFYRSFIYAGGAPLTISIQTIGTGVCGIDAVKLERVDAGAGFVFPTFYIPADGSAAVHIRNLSADNLTAGTLTVGGSSSDNPRINVLDHSNVVIVTIGDPAVGYYGVDIKGAAGLRVSGSGSVSVTGGGSVNVTGGGSINVTGGNVNVNSGGSVAVVGTGTISAQLSVGSARAELNVNGFSGFSAANVEQVRIDSATGALRVFGSGGVSIEGGGSILVGNPAAAHMVYDIQGLKAYDATNTKTVDISAVDGIARIDADALIVDGTVEFDSLNVSGEVHIGQTLRVGANVLFVNGTVGNVGINKSPDPQFDLDVAGNIRTDGYFVGKHALQIKDARMIVHFDGAYPFETNLTGVAMGHMGQVPTSQGGVLFRPGKFGKAAQFGRYSKNWINNPSAEIDATTVAVNNVTVSRVAGGYIGSWAFQCTVTSATNPFAWWSATSTAAGDNIYLQMVVKGTAGQQIRLRFYDGSATTYAPTTITLTGEWQYVENTAVSAGGGSAAYVEFLSGVGQVVLMDAVQLEINSGHHTPYLDGSLGTGFAWVGTPHNSASTRAAASIRYVHSAIDQNGGTLGFWYYHRADDIYADVFNINGTGSYLAVIYDPASLGWVLQTGTSGGYSRINSATTIPARLSAGWHYIACAWQWLGNGSLLRLFVDGVRVANAALAAYGLPTDGDLYVGGWQGDGSSDTLIDDVLITTRVLDDSEVLAIYASNAPVFAETSTFAFRSANNLAWADSEGLWAIDDLGNAAFGVSGVNGKSWGNIGATTLDKGDVLIGNGTHTIRWDASAGSLIFSGEGSGITNINGANIQTGTVTAATLSATAINGKTITGNTITGATISGTTMTSSTLTSTTINSSTINAGGSRVVINSSGIALTSAVTSSSSGYVATDTILWNDQVNPTGLTRAFIYVHNPSAGLSTTMALMANTAAQQSGIEITALNTGVGSVFFKNSDISVSGNAFVSGTLGSNGTITSGNNLVGTNNLILGGQSSYSIYWDGTNTAYRTNGNFVVNGDIWLGTRNFWLSGIVNQAVLTTSAPTFQHLTTTLNTSFGGTSGFGVGANTVHRVYIVGQSTTSSNGALLIHNSSFGQLLYVRCDGLAQIVTAWSVTSDARYKTDIKDDERGLKDLLHPKLASKRYKVKVKSTPTDTHKKKAQPEYTEMAGDHTGYLAQDVREVFPEMVTEDENGVLGIRYNDFIPMLVKAVQELKAEIDTLKDKKK